MFVRSFVSTFFFPSHPLLSLSRRDKEQYEKERDREREFSVTRRVSSRVSPVTPFIFDSLCSKSHESRHGIEREFVNSLRDG